MELLDKYILDAQSAMRKIERMALEFAEQISGDATAVVIIGIRNSGLVVAEKVGEYLLNVLPNKLTILSATLDKQLSDEVSFSEKLDFTGLHILLVDDVSNSGRTLTYALKPLLNFHPKSIRTMVLVERMHKQFPVKPDFVGLSIATTLEQHIKVSVEANEIKGAFVG